MSKMGPKNSSSLRSQDYFQRLTMAIEFAISEWLLMFLLFIDAFFAFLITKFASNRKLQDPCPICSRLDHVLARGKMGIYWNSVCDNHKSEISSIVHRTCQNCISSFGTKKSKNLDSHLNAPLLEIDYQKVNVTSDAAEEHKNEKNIFMDEYLESFSFSQVGKNRISPSMEVDYQKVNILSDTESELLVSEVHLKSNVQDEGKVLSSNVAETPAEVLVETTGVPKTGEIKNPITETEALSNQEANPIAITDIYQKSNSFDLGDAYKLAISTKARQLSGKLFDQKSFQESSTRISGDLKLLLSHRPSFQGVDFQSNDNFISPKLSLTSDESKTYESSMSMGMQFLQRRISLERNESNISIEGSGISEIEGESVVDRLKRQVEYDKKLMGVLYKELEEERNASAVATNEAMAMITRLQEEKAAVLMEALQVMRMMEEQAEYDGEAIRKANEIIEEKQKKIQDLENDRSMNDF